MNFLAGVRSLNVVNYLLDGFQHTKQTNTKNGSAGIRRSSHRRGFRGHDRFHCHEIQNCLSKGPGLQCVA
jgi:hypothetical protein